MPATILASTRSCARAGPSSAVSKDRFEAAAPRRAIRRARLRRGSALRGIAGGLLVEALVRIEIGEDGKLGPVLDSDAGPDARARADEGARADDRLSNIKKEALIARF